MKFNKDTNNLINIKHVLILPQTLTLIT